MGIRVGIDLGTTFSMVAKIDEQSGRPTVIRNGLNEPLTPSVLCFQKDSRILFGEDAKHMQAAGSRNAVAFFKRFMGNEHYEIEMFGKTYTATDLSAILLGKMKEEAERRVGSRIDAAVITVPAYFAHKERSATEEAGRRAGLDVICTINEPTAAALAYGLHEHGGSKTVLVYDLGGGTFDVSIARIDDKEIDVIGSNGNHELGGKDWDDCIARYLIDQFYERHGVNLAENDEMIASLIVAAERAKKQLTTRDVVHVPVQFQNFRDTIEITLDTFEAITAHLMTATRELTESLLESVGLAWSKLDGVVLVGGSTRMRMIHRFVREMSGKEPLSGVNVDEAVALGAAIRANMDDRGRPIMASIGGLFHRSGAPTVTIAGAKALSDVTAHSLGMISISADGRRYVNSRIIPKNSKIPAASSRTYRFRTQSRDNEMEVYVLQGEFDRPLDNVVVNKYVVRGIEKTSPPVSHIEVTYKYNANGIIEVSAMQRETGKSLPVRIERVPDDMSWTDESPREHGRTAKEAIVFLAVDLSGSMYGTPLKEAKKAMLSFVDQLGQGNVRFGIVAFAERSECVLEPSDHMHKVKSAIHGLDRIHVGDGTSAEPFTVSREQLMKPNYEDVDEKIIVVLTDGQWYGPDPFGRARECHRAGIRVAAIGFGDVQREFLKKIASEDGLADLTKLGELETSFSKIAQEIGGGLHIPGVVRNDE